MSPLPGCRRLYTPRFPRVSGDEPVDNCLILTGRQFSPRERG